MVSGALTSLVKPAPTSSPPPTIARPPRRAGVGPTDRANERDAPWTRQQVSAKC